MNKINIFFRSSMGKTVAILLILIIGFLGGMEYKAYQIRKAIGDAFGMLGNPQQEEKKEGDKIVMNDLDKKIGFEITKKKLSNEGFISVQEFTFQITNNTDQDIEGVQGTVNLFDLFGNKIKSVKLTYDKGISKGETKLYQASIDYNQFIDSDIKLGSKELSKMKYEFDVDTIIYKNGTKESK